MGPRVAWLALGYVSSGQFLSERVPFKVSTLPERIQSGPHTNSIIGWMEAHLALVTSHWFLQIDTLKAPLNRIRRTAGQRRTEYGCTGRAGYVRRPPHWIVGLRDSNPPPPPPYVHTYNQA